MQLFILIAMRFRKGERLSELNRTCKKRHFILYINDTFSEQDFFIIVSLEQAQRIRNVRKKIPKYEKIIERSDVAD